MKNIDFYENLLSHSLCFEFKTQMKIVRELIDLYKETIKSTITVCSECPKYIKGEFEKAGFKIIVNDNTSALYYDFHKACQNIKNDNKFDYPLIAKDFSCTCQADFERYIEDINEKLVKSNNSDIGTIAGMLIDIPNYYLSSLNLLDQYEYNFGTPIPSISYSDLFRAVYERISSVATYDIAMKELSALIILYYDQLGVKCNPNELAFLNPLPPQIKEHVREIIKTQLNVNPAYSLNELKDININKEEKSEDGVVSFKKFDANNSLGMINEYGRIYSVVSTYDLKNDEKNIHPIIIDAIRLSRRAKLHTNIEENLIVSLKEQHSGELICLKDLGSYPVEDNTRIPDFDLTIFVKDDNYFLIVEENGKKEKSDDEPDLKLYQLNVNQSDIRNIMDAYLEEAEYALEY